MPREHTGTWDYHDDDCRCTWVNDYCNRGGGCWSCCGACQKDSWCTTPKTHPTYWSHPLAAKCIDHYNSAHWPVHKSKEVIAELFPDLFS